MNELRNLYAEQLKDVVMAVVALDGKDHEGKQQLMDLWEDARSRVATDPVQYFVSALNTPRYAAACRLIKRLMAAI